MAFYIHTDSDEALLAALEIFQQKNQANPEPPIEVQYNVDDSGSTVKEIASDVVSRAIRNDFNQMQAQNHAFIKDPNLTSREIANKAWDSALGCFGLIGLDIR